MSDLFGAVVPKSGSVSEGEFHTLVVAGLARAAAKMGRGNLADRMGRTTRSVDKVFAGSTPDAKALFDVLLACPSALDEVLARYGFGIHPIVADAGEDMETAAGLCEAASDLIHANADGHRDYRETCRVADKLRPVVAHAMAIVHDADKIRGVAA